MTPQEAFLQLVAERPALNWILQDRHTTHAAYFSYAGKNWQQVNAESHAYAAELRKLEGVYSAGVKNIAGVDGNVVCATMESFRQAVVEPNQVLAEAAKEQAVAFCDARTAENGPFLAQAKASGKSVFIREYTQHEDGDFVYCKDFAQADGTIYTPTERDGNG